MQLRYKRMVTLAKAKKTKQPNGSTKNTYNYIGKYPVQVQDITDETSASIYGATINKMLRISSARHELEKLLKPKINTDTDNVSKYFIFYNNSIYKISAVKHNWLDIEFKESISD